MAITEVPWEASSLEAPEDFFALIPRHWPHYVNVTVEYSITWSASYTYDITIEGSPVPVTDTSVGSLSGSVSWSRQSSDDEMSEQTLDANKFAMRMSFEGNVSVSPRIDSALFHHCNLGTGDTITGSQTNVTHSVEDGEIVTNTETTSFTARPDPFNLGVYESGTATWAKKLGSVEFHLSGVSCPIALPSLVTSFVTSLGSNPNGAAIEFANSDTVTVSGAESWNGSSGASFTLTLS